MGLNRRKKFAIILVVYMIVLVIGIEILHGWIWAAHDNYKSSTSDEDQEFWYDEYKRRSETFYMELWIIGTTAIAALFMLFHDNIRTVQPEG